MSANELREIFQKLQRNEQKRVTAKYVSIVIFPRYIS